MRKLAVIRDNSLNHCPFGLEVTKACQTVGKKIEEMHSLENTPTNIKTKLISYNKSLFEQNEYPAKCKFAVHLFENKPNFVDCNFNDTAAGLADNTPFLGSNYYSKVLESPGVAGLLTPNENRQVDLPIFRDPYAGIYQWALKTYNAILKRSKS